MYIYIYIYIHINQKRPSGGTIPVLRSKPWLKSIILLFDYFGVSGSLLFSNIHQSGKIHIDGDESNIYSQEVLYFVSLT